MTPNLKYSLCSLAVAGALVAAGAVSADPQQHSSPPAHAMGHPAGHAGGSAWHGNHAWHGSRAWHGNSTWHGRVGFVAPHRFAAHSYAHFTAADRAIWHRGHWWHGPWHGRNGWWWFAGGAWYFYTAPIYPYPGYVSDYYYDDQDNYNPGPAAGAAPYNWYYCQNPPGYYPYIQSCNGPWQPVPATPPGYATNGPGAPGQGPDQGPDQSYGPQDQNGPPPGYNDNGPDDQNGPPPGYEQNGPGDQNGPPPGYDDNGPDNQGPPNGH
jgi:hypothetical protein